MEQLKSINSLRKEASLAEFILTLKKWYQYFLSKWWVLGLAGVLGGVSGFLYASLQQAKYEAAATFALEETKGGGALSLAAEFGLDFGGGSTGAFSGDNILSILTSRRIIQRALLCIDTLDGKSQTLAEEFIDVYNIRKEFIKHPQLKNVTFPPGLDKKKFNYIQDSVLFDFCQAIKNKSLVVKKSEKKQNMNIALYYVNVTTPNEKFSKTLLEKIISEAITFYTEICTKKSLEIIKVLEKRVNEERGFLNSSISSKASIQDANLSPAFAAAQVPLQQKQVDVQVFGTAYGELYKNLELARYQYLKEKPLLQMIDEPEYPLKKIKLGRLSTGIIFAVFSFFLMIFFLLIRRIFKTSLQSVTVHHD